jgi:hypothetical protein
MKSLSESGGKGGSDGGTLYLSPLLPRGQPEHEPHIQTGRKEKSCWSCHNGVAPANPIDTPMARTRILVWMHSACWSLELSTVIMKAVILLRINRSQPFWSTMLRSATDRRLTTVMEVLISNSHVGAHSNSLMPEYVESGRPGTPWTAKLHKSRAARSPLWGPRWRFAHLRGTWWDMGVHAGWSWLIFSRLQKQSFIGSPASQIGPNWTSTPGSGCQPKSVR